MSKKSEETQKHASVVLDYQNNQRALTILKDKGHGSMRKLVGAFIRAYLKAPDKVYLFIVQVNAGLDAVAPPRQAISQPVKTSPKVKSVFGQVSTNAMNKSSN